MALAYEAAKGLEFREIRDAQETFTSDSNAEVHDYFNEIASRLVAASDQKPLFPIEVHVSSVLINNAEAIAGGQIILYGRMFDTTDDESQLVAVIADEVAHELHNDFMKFWQDYKENKDIDGSGGVLEQSVMVEAAADETGARYIRGWLGSEWNG